MMLEQNTATFENNKKSLRIKSIFRETYAKKSINRLEISPPILQHSTSIFSLVSPTRTHNLNDLYHPLASPPPVPKSHHATNNTNARYTLASDPREHSRKKSTSTSKPAPSRRHSYSTTPMYIKPQSKAPEVKQPPATELKYVKSIRKIPERRRSSVSQKSGTTSSAAASIQPTASKSTPLKKVKTYNVQKKMTPQEKEKLRKMQELEDLISGRRGSTLKLTLTPKGLK